MNFDINIIINANAKNQNTHYQCIDNRVKVWCYDISLNS